MLSSDPEDDLDLYVFKLAILLVKGVQFMLVVPPFSISMDGGVHEQCGEGCGEVQLVTHVDSFFFKMFLWERFSMVTPKLLEFSIMVMEEVVFPYGSRATRPSNAYKPRAWR